MSKIKKGQGRCEAALPREKKMPSMSDTDGMENMLGTTQKESTEGQRSKGALLASKRKPQPCSVAKSNSD
jgi:hypothetical protein